MSEAADIDTSTPQAAPDAGASAAAATQTASFLESMTAEVTASAAPSDAAPVAPSADGRPEGVPEKFWDAEKKAIRTEDVLKSYQALEQRMRDGGAPPKDVTGYAFEPPEELADVKLNDDGLKAFKETAHKLGLTAKQYQGVMNHYIETLPHMREDLMTFTMQECEAQIRDVWKTDRERRENSFLAKKAFSALADEDMLEPDVKFRLENHPYVLRILAKVGKEMGEDKINVNQQSGDSIEDDIAALNKHPALRDENHPQHRDVNIKWFNAQQRKNGQQELASTYADVQRIRDKMIGIS